MFLDYYGLREQPFGVTPDPRYLYLSPARQEAFAALVYGIEAGQGLMALIGQPGLGKTTLLSKLLEHLQGSARTAYLFQTQCDSRELFHYLLADLGIETHEQNMVQMHTQLDNALRSEARAHRRVVLIIDEAQNLDEQVLGTVRLLSNFETARSKLLQIVLAGQPRLAEILASPSNARLRQRFTVVRHLDPFDAAETEEYISHRLRVAGYNGGPLFTPGALGLISDRSAGIPREINNLCFGALSLGFALDQRVIDSALMQEAVHDLDAGLPPPPTVGITRPAAARATVTTPLTTEYRGLGGVVMAPAAASRSLGPAVSPSASVARATALPPPAAAAVSFAQPLGLRIMPRPISGSGKSSTIPPLTRTAGALALAVPVAASPPIPKPAPRVSKTMAARLRNLHWLPWTAPLILVALATIGFRSSAALLHHFRQKAVPSSASGSGIKPRSGSFAALSAADASGHAAQKSPVRSARAHRRSASTGALASKTNSSQTTSQGEPGSGRPSPDESAANGNSPRSEGSPLASGISARDWLAELRAHAKPNSPQNPQNQTAETASGEPPLASANLSRPRLAAVSGGGPGKISELARHQTVTIGGEVQPPQLVSRPMPQYPIAAKLLRVQGTVRIICVVGQDGTVKKTEVVDGPALLRNAAIEAVAHWRFNPASVDGTPLEAQEQVEVTFSLQ